MRSSAFILDLWLGHAAWCRRHRRRSWQPLLRADTATDRNYSRLALGLGERVLARCSRRAPAEDYGHASNWGPSA